MRKDINYQNKAVECLISLSKNYLNRQESKGNTIFYMVLQAITGAGKTVIVSKYIKEMLPDSTLGQTDELAFVWLSVGKGNLHIQSSKKLEQYLYESAKIMMADEAVLNKMLNAGEILVLNWESLNTKKIDPKTGFSHFDNIFMRDGDKPNLQTLWGNTRNAGIKIVLIIDESHNTAGSETSREIIELIDPAYVVELTATPNFANTNPKGEYDYCTVKASDVIDEEVIKKNIRLNDTTEKENNEGILKNLLEQAITKQKELKQAYINEGIDYINPLCLIQLPDGKEGKILKEEVVSILHEKGINYSNKKLAIWLAEKEDKINLEDINNMSSSVEYLIFKQAIATGWDCPRASILVKLRDIKSEIFDLQTIGRILRMPELKHYKNEILNDSYIYTNAEYTLNTGGYPNVLPQRQVLKGKFKDDVLNMKFISETVTRDKIDISEKDIIKMFNSIISKEKDKLTSDEIRDITLMSANISSVAFHKKSQTEIVPNDKTEIKVKYSTKDIDRLYKLMINEIKNDVLTYTITDNLIINYFKSITSETEISKLKRIILSNKQVISEVFTKLKGEINKRRYTETLNKDFAFPGDRHANEKETIFYEKCAYEKHFASKYNTEKMFEKFLESKDSVLYWIKNGDAGQNSLSVAYNDGENDKGFFPDYIIKFKDNTIGLFEVKDINDREKNTITPKKIAALKDYCNKYGYACGLIQIEDEKVHLSSLPDIFKKES